MSPRPVFSRLTIPLLRRSAAATALVALSGSTAWGQETEPPATPSSSQGVEEIVVTGQQTYYDREARSALKIDARILETPQSVFVINDDLIADQQAFRLDQILQNDSSVQKANNFLGAYSSYQIRGFDLDNGANYLRDGRSFFQQASPPVEVLDRVEVLKGPASVLYGSMAPGGLINQIPKRPQAEFETSIKATYGSFDTRHYHLDHGGPLTESGNVRYRFNAVYEDSESHRKFADGQRFDTQRRTLAAAIDWDISERTQLRINFDDTDDDRPQDLGLISTTGSFSGLDYDLIYNQPYSQYDSEVSNLSIQLSHELTSWLEVQTGVSQQKSVRDRYDNELRGPPSDEGDVNLRVRRRVNRREYRTFFMDVLSTFETGPLEHRALLGYDLTEVDIDNNETLGQTTFTTNIFRPEVLPDPGISTRPENRTGDDRRTGIYFQDLIAIGDHVRLLLGGRYDHYEEEQENETGVDVFEEKARAFSPRVGVVVLPTESLSLYASFSESFEPNSPVGAEFDNAGERLDPTLGRQLEVGAKWEAFDGDLFVTGALFTIDRENVPFRDLIANTLEQAGVQNNTGAELSVVGLIGENLTLSGSATWLDAEFEKSEVDEDGLTLEGNTPAGVPSLAVSLAAEYAFPKGGPLEGLALQAGWFFESDRPVDNENTFDLDAYNRFDVGLKYVQSLGEERELIYRLTVQNATDEEYFKGSSRFAVNPERPMEIRGSVEMNF